MARASVILMRVKASCHRGSLAAKIGEGGLRVLFAQFSVDSLNGALMNSPRDRRVLAGCWRRSSWRKRK